MRVPRGRTDDTGGHGLPRMSLKVKKCSYVREEQKLMITKQVQQLTEQKTKTNKKYQNKLVCSCLVQALSPLLKKICQVPGTCFWLSSTFFGHSSNFFLFENPREIHPCLYPTLHISTYYQVGNSTGTNVYYKK